MRSGQSHNLTAGHFFFLDFRLVDDLVENVLHCAKYVEKTLSEFLILPKVENWPPEPF